MLAPSDLPVPLTPARVQLLCDRHRGVGADGIVAVVGDRDRQPVAVEVWNADGSN